MKRVSQSDRIAEKRVDVALDNGPCVAANTAETDLSSLSAYVRFRRLCGSVHGAWAVGNAATNNAAAELVVENVLLLNG